MTNSVSEEIVIPAYDVNMYINLLQLQSKISIKGFRLGHVPSQFILFNKWREITSNLLSYHIYFNFKNVENYSLISVIQLKNGDLKYNVNIIYKAEEDNIGAQKDEDKEKIIDNKLNNEEELDINNREE